MVSLSVFAFKVSISLEICSISARSTLLDNSCLVANELVSISGFVSSACNRLKISESSKVATSTRIFLIASSNSAFVTISVIAMMRFVSFSMIGNSLCLSISETRTPKENFSKSADCTTFSA